MWQMMTFLNPLNAMIPKIPFSFFSDFWVWVTSGAQGVSLGRWGSCQLSPFWGGGSDRRALSTPPPPGNENPASRSGPSCCARCVPSLCVCLLLHWTALSCNAICPPPTCITSTRWHRQESLSAGAWPLVHTSHALQDHTGIEEADLKRTLQSLALGPVRPIKKRPKGKDVTEDDLFAYASDFSHKQLRIKVNQIQMKETPEEQKHCNEKVNRGALSRRPHAIRCP